jgi:hypothetical protein
MELGYFTAWGRIETFMILFPGGSGRDEKIEREYIWQLNLTTTFVGELTWRQEHKEFRLSWYGLKSWCAVASAQGISVPTIKLHTIDRDKIETIGFV